jgi:hypothetical protein
MIQDLTLSLSTVKAIINAPIEMVDIADWLLHLPDAEYQRCSHAHIAGASSTSDDGRPMSIKTRKRHRSSRRISRKKPWQLLARMEERR